MSQTKTGINFFKANALFWLLGATDGHAKNFCLGLMPGGRVRMTPLYDVLTVQPTLDAQQLERRNFKLAMYYGKPNHYKAANIVGRHIVEAAVRSGMSRDVVKRLFEELQDLYGRIVNETFCRLPLGLPDELLASVDGALRARLPLLHG